MLPCHNGPHGEGRCAYAREIPGDCHISCTFDWGVVPVDQWPQFNATPKQRKWFIWPFNYDPVWGDGCERHTLRADPARVRQSHPFEQLTAMLVKRML